MSETESYHAMMQRQMRMAQEVHTWQEHYTTCPSCYCSVSRGQALSHVKDLMHQGEQLLARAQEFEVEVPEQIMAMLRSGDYHAWSHAYRWLQDAVRAAQGHRPEPEAPKSNYNFLETLNAWFANNGPRIMAEQPDGPQGPDTPPEDEPPLQRPDNGNLQNPYRGIERVQDVPWSSERDDERERVTVR